MSLDWYVNAGKSRAFELAGTFFDLGVHCLMAYSLVILAVSDFINSKSTKCTSLVRVNHKHNDWFECAGVLRESNHVLVENCLGLAQRHSDLD